MDESKRSLRCCATVCARWAVAEPTCQVDANQACRAGGRAGRQTQVRTAQTAPDFRHLASTAQAQSGAELFTARRGASQRSTAQHSNTPNSLMVTPQTAMGRAGGGGGGAGGQGLRHNARPRRAERHRPGQKQRILHHTSSTLPQSTAQRSASRAPHRLAGRCAG